MIFLKSIEPYARRYKNFYRVYFTCLRSLANDLIDSLGIDTIFLILFLSMKYKGYMARVEFDDESGIFFGKVVNMSKDGITFQGSSAEELREEFHLSVDDYLSWCGKTRHFFKQVCRKSPKG